jgi:hypothetical protein
MGLGFIFLTTILFVRTTGLHIDEWSYLSSAVHSWKEAPGSSGKSPLFYWMNYKLHHEIARSFGPLKPVTMYLFYIAAFATSLVWAIRPLIENRRGRLAMVYLVLLVSPLALLNSTQLMMETAILPLVSLTFGAVLRGVDSNWKLVRLFVLSGLLIAIKSTGAPVVLLLAAISYRHSKKTAMTLGIGAFAGFLGSQAALRWIVHVAHSDNYGGLSELLAPAVVWQRLTSAGPDIYLWLFFVGIAAIAGGLLWAFNRSRSSGLIESKPSWLTDGNLLALALGSLVLMLFMQSISIYGFARYNYPNFWLGLLASVLLVARQRISVLLPLAAVFCFQSLPLLGRGVSRFDLWPSRTVVEFMESGGTILMSTPVHRLVVEQLLRDPAPCYEVGPMDPQEREYYLRYFEFAFPKGKVADPSQSCASTIRVWRDPVKTVEAACPARCEKSIRWSGCGYQQLKFFTVHTGLTLNQVCW